MGRQEELSPAPKLVYELEVRYVDAGMGTRNQISLENKSVNYLLNLNVKLLDLFFRLKHLCVLSGHAGGGC